MLKLPARTNSVQTELKGNLLIWPRSRPDWYRKLNGFEVKKLDRQWIGGQISSRTRSIKVGLVVERMRFDTPLSLIEQIIRNIAEIIDPGFSQLAHLGRRESR